MCKVKLLKRMVNMMVELQKNVILTFEPSKLARQEGLGYSDPIFTPETT